jgi:hydrogenase nickel incorporation protein HypA/HybF
VHELSVVAGLFELLESQAREHQAQKITGVKLRVGEFSGIVPELLESAFEIYRKGTIAAEARLEIEVVPVRVRCRTCGEDASMEEDYTCRGCRGRDFEILEGRELVVDKIELEIP